MNRIQTVLLAAITVLLAAQFARDTFPSPITAAHAETPANIACETWVFDMDIGKAKGAANVEAHRVGCDAR